MAQSSPSSLTETEKALIQAQNKAQVLFNAIEERQLIAPGFSELEINQKIYDLAHELFGITKYWHKRIVRAGQNTLCPYRENPPNLVVRENDIVFLDFGPIFEDWEADFGRTYVLGDDPNHLRLKADLEAAFWEGKRYFDATPDITGSQLYAFMCDLAKRQGWAFGHIYAGHLIGKFPHEKVLGDNVEQYIHRDNHRRMRDLDCQGNPQQWILEVHFIDSDKQFGGFMEQLLTIDYP